ncbi:MAG: LacI family DNA-binding transcriptional regulator [Kiritimatiellae bacterium]|jgi:DNA-binding LacI/PurR family transcriptional regulator|nr:LacI family DNA-binding transcriptional regulator [Kiritimatiellia bacterium]
MRANIKDVARKSGYSISAVSQALNNMPGTRLSEKAREKIAKCAKRLAYRPHPTALALRRGRGAAVSLILPDIFNPFFMDIASGVQGALAAQGYEALIQHCGHDLKREQILLAQAVERRAEGVVILAMNNAQHYGRYARRLPLVRLSGIRSGGGGTRIDSVAFDLTSGFCQAADYLIKLGHTRIGLLNRRFDRRLIHSRRAGYIKALRQGGIVFDAGRVFEVDGFSAEAGYEFGRDHRDFLRKLTALLAYNDVMAIGLMKAARESGLKIPGDLSIIGCDGILWGEYSDPPLTTVCMPGRVAGQEAGRILLERMQGRTERNQGEQAIMPTSLIVRNSCGAI